MSQLRPVFAFLPLLLTALPASSEAPEWEVSVRLTGTGVPANLGNQRLLRLVTDPGDDGLVTVAALPGGLVLERTEALPRYRWATEPLLVTDAAERLDLLAGGLRPEQVIVEEAIALPSVPGTAEVRSVDESDPDRRRFEVVASGSGMLVIADAHLSGWRVRVNGRAGELVTADHAMMGVVLPAGTHTVELVYHSRVLGALWWSGLGVVALLTVALRDRGALRWRPGRARP